MNSIRIEEKEGLAWIWLDLPGEKINKISFQLLDEFETLLDRFERSQGIRALVLISAKADNFIAGADIEAFLHMTEKGQAAELSRRGNRLLQRLAASSKPVLAAIHGAALGGGLEVALACHYRLATEHPKTVLGLPEVKLGLLPAGGGTQRLPRLIGLRRSLQYLLTGKNIYPRQARKMGLVDELVHPWGLPSAAQLAAQRLLDGKRRKRRRRSWAERLLEENPLGRRLIYRMARRQTLQQTGGHYPAPLKILDCVRIGLEKGLEAGLEAEAQGFDELMRTPQARELIQLFFSMNAARKNPLAEQARPVRRLGILGAGLMGSGIAQVSAEEGFTVLLKDLDQQALARGEKAIWEELQGRVGKRILAPFQRDQIWSRIHGVIDYSGFASVDLVIEAVFEDLEIKRRVVQEVEAHLPEQAVLASNTSSLPIASIAEASRRPEQVIGMHYFSPVPKMPLLEIVVTPRTAEWVQATAIEAGLRQGKHVIVVGDGPGFYTTRILAPLMNEALLLLEEGARTEEIDQAMRRFGFPVGPLALMDEVGIDVGAHVSQVLAGLFARRGVTGSGKAAELLEAGYKGRKNRKGFYRYPARGKGKKEPNQEIYRFFGGARRRHFSAQEIQERLFLAMINEALYCLGEGILRSPRDGDLGAVLGLGFPPFLGGPFRYLDREGPGRVLERLQRLEAKHGARFRPAPLLQEQVERKKPFYPS